MDNDCFNIPVRILACDEEVLFTDPPIHYMDLRFCVSYHNSSFIIIIINMFLNNFSFTQSMMRDSTRDQKFCDKETI